MPDDAPISGFRSIGEIAREMVGDMQKSCSQTTSYGKNEAAVEGVTSTRDGLNTAAEKEPRMSLNQPATRQVKGLSVSCGDDECGAIAAAARGHLLRSDEVWPFIFEHMLARGGLGHDQAITGKPRGWMISEYDTALSRVASPELRGALAMGFADSIRRSGKSDFPIWMVVDCLTQSPSMTFGARNIYRLAEDFALAGAAVRSVVAAK